jgi:hypothetical protein
LVLWWSNLGLAFYIPAVVAALLLEGVKDEYPLNFTPYFSNFPMLF